MNKQEILDVVRDNYLEHVVIMGYLMKSKNKVMLGDYNKLADEAGLLKLKRQEFVDLAGKLHSGDSNTQAVLQSTLEGTITLSDVTDTKEEEVFSVLTPYVVAKEENMANNREFMKYQRSGANMERLMKGLREANAKEALPLKEFVSTPRKKDLSYHDYEMIVCLSDWHVGALVYNEDTGGYNFEIFQERLAKFIEEVKRSIKLYNVKRIRLYHLGDLIEHINMRNVNQAFDAEFPATEQISKANRVLIQVLMELSAIVDVTFGMVGGNHDRFQGDKGDKIYNDNVAYVVLDNIIHFQEMGLLPNVNVIDNRKDVYSFVDKVGGKTVKAVHGDTEGKKVDQKIPKHIKTEVVNLLLMGHIHTFRMVQEDYDRYHIYTGSTMGANEYSKEHNFPTTFPSQLILVIPSNGGDVIAHPVNL